MSVPLVTSIVVLDSANPVELTAWLTDNPLTQISSITVYGNAFNIIYNVNTQVSVLKTGTLATATLGANQIILTYTVSPAKTFFLEYVTLAARLTTLPGNANPIYLGTASVETPTGIKIITQPFISPTQSLSTMTFEQPIPLSTGTVIRIVCTPAVVGTTWIANFGGYEL